MAEQPAVAQSVNWVLDAVEAILLNCAIPFFWDLCGHSTVSVLKLSVVYVQILYRPRKLHGTLRAG